jgi:hypothetical protein
MVTGGYPDVRRDRHKLLSEHRVIFSPHCQLVVSLSRLSQLLFVSALAGPSMMNCAVPMAGWMPTGDNSKLHIHLSVYLPIQKVNEASSPIASSAPKTKYQRTQA